MRLGPIMPAGRSYYSTDFREYTVGTQLSSSDWTERSGTGNTWTMTADTSSISGEVVVSDGIGNDVTSLTWDRLGSSIGSSDFDVLALIKRSTMGSSSPRLAGLTRTISTGEDGVAWGFSSTSNVELSEYASGLYVSGTSASFSSDTSTWYWMRFSRATNLHTGKIWAYGSAESTATTVTRSTSRSGGNIGFFIVNAFGGIRSAWFSAATGGAKAPGPSG